MIELNKNQRIKNISKYIKDLAEKGLDILKVTEGKTVEQLAHSKVTYNNFMKRRKRQLERPKIIEESKKISEKIKKQKRLSNNRNKVTDKSHNIVRDNMDFEPTKKNIELKTKLIAHDFFYRYFKELSLNAHDQKRINKLVNRFGCRLDLIYKFMDDSESLQFKYPYEKELMKQGYADEYEEHMRERLESFEKLLEIKYGI